MKQNRSPKETFYRRTNTTIADENGEVKHETQIDEYKRERHPAFFKTFIDDLGRLYELPPHTMKLLHELARTMSYQNVVTMYKPVKMIIAQNLQMKLTTINQGVQILRNKGILIPMNKYGRGLYLIDPMLFGKGDWTNIQKLRLIITYNGVKRSISMEKVKQLEMQFEEITIEKD